MLSLPENHSKQSAGANQDLASMEKESGIHFEEYSHPSFWTSFYILGATEQAVHEKVDTFAAALESDDEGPLSRSARRQTDASAKDPSISDPCNFVGYKRWCENWLRQKRNEFK